MNWKHLRRPILLTKLDFNQNKKVTVYTSTRMSHVQLVFIYDYWIDYEYK